MSRRTFHLSLRGGGLALGPRTAVMGILNVTPDSFSGDGQLRHSRWQEAALRRGMRMVRDGADILDVGGESTRPGAARVSVTEEIRRVVPVIGRLVQKAKVPVSIDTCKPEVAFAALDAGAAMVNIVNGPGVSVKMLRLVQRYQAAIVLMHMRGTPRTMLTKTRYQDLMKDIVLELKKSVEKCRETGIKEESIIVDPGIGFSKDVGQNFEILRRLHEMSSLPYPVLIGPSRKSFIGKTLNLDVRERLWGTAAAVTAGILNGAHIIRVHDVPQMKQIVRIADAVLAAR